MHLQQHVGEQADELWIVRRRSGVRGEGSAIPGSGRGAARDHGQSLEQAVVDDGAEPFGPCLATQHLGA